MKYLRLEKSESRQLHLANYSSFSWFLGGIAGFLFLFYGVLINGLLSHNYIWKSTALPDFLAISPTRLSAYLVFYVTPDEFSINSSRS